jgi:tetratricopeptide (TPR) repeat protein
MTKYHSLPAGALLVAALAAATSAMAVGPLNKPGATETAPPLRLVVFREAPGGTEIVHGSYQRGLDQAGTALSRGYRDKAVLYTHICAAQIKLGQFVAANESCEAVLANNLEAGLVISSRRLFAAAHVNHGVVHFMQGDQEMAQQEFRRAKASDPTLRVAASNLALTQQLMREPLVEVEQTL